MDGHQKSQETQSTEFEEYDSSNRVECDNEALFLPSVSCMVCFAFSSGEPLMEQVRWQ